MTDTVERARAAFARQAWGDAYALLERADALEAEDLEQLAVAAYLVGRDEESRRAWERAHLEHVQRGQLAAAARCAGWLVIDLVLGGDMAQAAGWCARATRLLDEAEVECAGRGLLDVPAALGALIGGDPATAGRLMDGIIALARRYGDDDVLAIGLLGRGQAALASGEAEIGMRLLDEVMVSVASGEVSPIPAGIVYCAVIEACMDVMDLRRATEWTGALSDWCAGQPDLVPYRGQCLVHRSQVLQAHGDWEQAATEIEQAQRRLSEPAHPALGLALYQEGELHRLRGEPAQAERAYRAAAEHGRQPAPGLALLRLDEGRLDAAAAAIRRMVEESRGQLTYPAMLAASVEIMLAIGELERARAHADELAKLADAAPLRRVIADYAVGTVSLADGDAVSALTPLRRAHVGWRELDMPYEAACARVQIGLACRVLDDHDAADHELDGARVVFERLGARPALARTVALLSGETRPPPKELTGRECEVLRLVASGRTNREIAAALVISEHTVGRHLQNIFMKIGVSSRAGATAFAYEHDLV